MHIATVRPPRRPHLPPPPPSGPGRRPADAPDAEDPIEAVVRSAVAETLGRADVPPGVRFYDDLGFDSVMYMQLRCALERRLPECGELPLPVMLPSLTDLDALVRYLHGCASAAARP